MLATYGASASIYTYTGWGMNRLYMLRQIAGTKLTDLRLCVKGGAMPVVGCARRVCRVPLATGYATARRAAFNPLIRNAIMAKAAKVSLAPTPVPAAAPAAPKLTWSVDGESGRTIVSEDGKTWRFPTDEEFDARDYDAEDAELAETEAPPVPAPLPATAPAVPAGFALVPDTSEVIPIPGQDVITDGKPKAADIALSSPVDRKGVPVTNDTVATLQRQITALTAERDAAKLERDRLYTINAQLREAYTLAKKHIEELHSDLDSMGIRKTPGL